MEKRKYDNKSLGMLAGIVLGAGLGVVLFAATGQVLFFILAGAGAGIGLSLGAAVDHSLKP